MLSLILTACRASPSAAPPLSPAPTPVEAPRQVRVAPPVLGEVLAFPEEQQLVMEQVAGILDLDGKTGRPLLLLYIENLHEMGYNVAVSRGGAGRGGAVN